MEIKTLTEFTMTAASVTCCSITKRPESGGFNLRSFSFTITMLGRRQGV